MKLKYVINDDPTHYMLVDLNSVSKMATMQYWKSGLLQMERVMSIAEVLDVEPTTNPKVEIAKRGYLWDVHVFKLDALGTEIRRTISMTTPLAVVSTKLEMINDSTTDITLKDYLTHPLATYSSKLTLVEKTFDDVDGLLGTSGNTSSTPVVDNGKLKLGNASQISVPFASAIDIAATPFTVVVEVDSLGLNDVSNDYQFGIKLGSSGSNELRFDSRTGVIFRSANTAGDVTVMPPTAWVDKIYLMIESLDSGVKLYVNGSMVILNDFAKAEIMDGIVLSAMCNDDKETLVDYLLVQKTKS